MCIMNVMQIKIESLTDIVPVDSVNTLRRKIRLNFLKFWILWIGSAESGSVKAVCISASLGKENLNEPTNLGDVVLSSTVIGWWGRWGFPAKGRVISAPSPVSASRLVPDLVPSTPAVS